MSQTSQRAPSGAVGPFIRRHLPLSLVIVAAVAAGAALIVNAMDETYTSSATVRVDANDERVRPDPEQFANVPDEERYVLDQQELMSSERLLDVVSTRTQVSTEELKNRVRVDQPDLSNTVQVSAVASDPEVAQSIVEQTVAVYMEQHLQTIRDRFDNALALLDSEAEAADANNQELLAELAQRRADVVARRATFVTTTEVVSPASLPLEPDGPSPLQLVLAASVLALAAVAVVIVIREQRRPREYGPEAMARHFGELPLVRVRSSRSSKRRPPQLDDHDVSELVSQLECRGLGRDFRTIAVIAIDGQSRESLVRSMAQSLSQRGAIASKLTISSDADGRFILSGAHGDVYLAPAYGWARPSMRIDDAIRANQPSSDVVVVDLTSVTSIGRAVALAVDCDSVLLVVPTGSVDKSVLDYAGVTMEAAKLFLLGAVSAPGERTYPRVVESERSESSLAPPSEVLA